MEFPTFLGLGVFGLSKKEERSMVSHFSEFWVAEVFPEFWELFLVGGDLEVSLVEAVLSVFRNILLLVLSIAVRLGGGGKI